MIDIGPGVYQVFYDKLLSFINTICINFLYILQNHNVLLFHLFWMFDSGMVLSFNNLFNSSKRCEGLLVLIKE